MSSRKQGRAMPTIELLDEIERTIIVLDWDDLGSIPDQVDGPGRSSTAFPASTADLEIDFCAELRRLNRELAAA